MCSTGFPPAFGHAVVGGWRDGDDVVVVMHDLGDAVIGWETPIGRPKCRRLFTAAASMHLAFAGAAPEGLCPLEHRLSLFTPRRLRASPAGEEALIDAALAGWERFPELVPPDVAAAISAVHDDPTPLAGALAARGTTLAHGDLWLVNAAFDHDPDCRAHRNRYG